MPRKKGALTAPQKKVMAILHAYWQKRWPMPTRREISNAMGWESVNAAQDVLRALEKKGHVRLKAGSARAIEVLA